jgi:hypothetical protein
MNDIDFLIERDVKVNALPEEAHAIVNHRVAVDNFSVRKPCMRRPILIRGPRRIHERYIKRLTAEAANFNLSVVGACSKFHCGTSEQASVRSRLRGLRDT